jgi:fatty-acyl-CoA synthase
MICADIIGERSRLSPDRTAVVDVATGARLSYREMDHRASACARAWLYGLGLKTGDRVGILSGNRLEFLDAFFAAAKSGVILVPLGTRLTAAELALIVSDCKLSALIYSGEHARAIGDLVAVVDVGRLVALDGEGDDLTWEKLLASIGEGEYVPPVCRPDDPYCLLYTSGTTGRPKGVITPHRMVAWNAYNTVACWQLSEDDVSPICTPLYHAGGLGAFLMPILLAGGTIVLHREFDASEVWRVIVEERCTVVLGVPTIWKMLADAPEFATADLSSVRWFISGGAPLPRHLVGVFRDRGVVMRQGYGLTEVGVNCFAMSDEEAWEKAGSIGKPLMFTEALFPRAARERRVLEQSRGNRRGVG